MRMIKRILIAILILVVVAVAALVIFIKTFDINRYKSKITTELSRQLGRDLSLDKIDLSLSVVKGLQLNLFDLLVKDDPRFSQDNFFQVRQVSLTLDVMSFLKERKITIASVLVSQPRVRLIKGGSGELNIPSAPAAGPSEGAVGTPPQGEAEAPAPPAQTALPEIMIKSIGIEKGEMIYLEKTDQGDRTVTVRDIDCQLADVSLTQPFTFTLNFGIENDRDNVEISGKVQVDQKQQQARLDDVKVSVDLSAIPVANMTAFLPEEQKGLFKSQPQGQLEILLSQCVVGASGLPVFSLTGQLQGGVLSLSSVPVDINALTVNFSANDRDLEVQDFSSAIASGKISGKASVRDYLKSPSMNANLQVLDLAIGEIMASQKLPVDFQGLLNAEAKLSGQGLTPEEIQKSLAGEGWILVKGGVLKDFNVLKIVLSNISMLPGLVEKIEASLPERYQKVLEQKDTTFEKIEGDFRIVDGVVFETDLAAEVVALSNSGRLDWKQDLELRGTVLIPKDLSEGMVKAVNELGALLDEEGRVKIPLQAYQGPLTALKMMPDLEYLGKKIIVEKGKEEIKDLLSDVLKKSGVITSPEEGTAEPSSGDAAGQPAATETAPSTDDQPVEQKIIENILDSVFE